MSDERDAHDESNARWQDRCECLESDLAACRAASASYITRTDPLLACGPADDPAVGKCGACRACALEAGDVARGEVLRARMELAATKKAWSESAAYHRAEGCKHMKEILELRAQLREMTALRVQNTMLHAALEEVQKRLRNVVDILAGAVKKELSSESGFLEPLLTPFAKCLDGRHDECAGQSDKLFRSGRLAKCSCECHQK